MILLPDVSHYQGFVDWGAVLKSGASGGICKATQGLGVDPTFVYNWQTLGGLGAVRGAYHFADTTHPAETQAWWYMQKLQTPKSGDILILDIESGDGDLSAWALEWLSRVKQMTGITPWLYSYGPFIREHLTDPALAQYPLWLAAYTGTPPVCPAPWQQYDLWQFTDRNMTPGISGLSDESRGTLPTRQGGTSVAGTPDFALTGTPCSISAVVVNNAVVGYYIMTDDGSVAAIGNIPYLGRVHKA